MARVTAVEFQNGSLPDIDLDFPQSKKPLIREYLEWRYGADRVCGVGTLSRMQPKAVLADLCRAMDIPYDQSRKMASIVEQIGEIETDQEGLTWDVLMQEAGGELAAWADRYPELFQKMQILLGIIRQSSTHAAGVLISDTSLLGEIPLRVKNGELVSQFENSSGQGSADVEDLGFVKYDVLGLKHVEILTNVAKMISGDPNKPLDLDMFYRMDEEKLSDPEVWKPVGDGETLGIFQLEAATTHAATKRFKPNNEREAADLISITRPGVVRAGMLDHYLNRRNGTESPSSLHPLVDKITESSLGVVLFQEQVMEIAKVCAQYGAADAEKLRKILGKRKVEVMQKEKPRFIRACMANEEFARGCGVRDVFEVAEQVWDSIEASSSYSFNKCLRGGTAIFGENEEWTVEDLYLRSQEEGGLNGLKAMSLGLSTGEISPKPIKDVFFNGIREIIEIQTESGRSIGVTGNHRLADWNGWIEASDIDPSGDGAYLVMQDFKDPKLTMMEKVVSVTKLPPEPVYDLEMDDEDHNFIAEGFVSHNSHAQAYAMITSWEVWFKHYYPKEYLVALMQVDPARVPQFLTEAKRRDYAILPPDINVSEDRFTLVDGEIRYGLSDIDGVGASAYKDIVANRPFTSVEDFYNKTNGRGARRKNVVLNLIAVGAFDNISDSRKEASETFLKLSNPKKWQETKLPNFNNRMEVAKLEEKLLGRPVTWDPMDEYSKLIAKNCISSPDQIETYIEKQEVLIGGKVARVKEHQAKNGLMAFVDIEWSGDMFNILCFADRYEVWRPFLEVGAPVVVSAKKLKKGAHLVDLVRLDMTD